MAALIRNGSSAHEAVRKTFGDVMQAHPPHKRFLPKPLCNSISVPRFLLAQRAMPGFQANPICPR